MTVEEKYDSMSEEEREVIEETFSDWNKLFEQAKESGDDINVYQLITETDSTYCLWKILQYLKEIARLEESKDAMEHWRGYLAGVNIKVCRNAMRNKERET